MPFEEPWPWWPTWEGITPATPRPNVRVESRWVGSGGCYSAWPAYGFCPVWDREERTCGPWWNVETQQWVGDTCTSWSPSVERLAGALRRAPGYPWEVRR